MNAFVYVKTCGYMRKPAESCEHMRTHAKTCDAEPLENVEETLIADSSTTNQHKKKTMKVPDAAGLYIYIYIKKKIVYIYIYVYMHFYMLKHVETCGSLRNHANTHDNMRNHAKSCERIRSHSRTWNKH
jgi:hypothetical protein